MRLITLIWPTDPPMAAMAAVMTAITARSSLVSVDGDRAASTVATGSAVAGVATPFLRVGSI